MRLLKVRILFQQCRFSFVASAYAALAGACNEALQLGLSDKDLSRLARRGSGSKISQYLWWIWNGKKEMTMKLPLHTVLKRMVGK